MKIFFYFLIIVCFFAFQIRPIKIEKDIPFTTKIVYGGRRLLFVSFWGTIFQIFNVLLFKFQINNILLFILILITFLNGFFRILIFSFRLRVLRRVLISVFILIPIINIFVIFYMRNVAKDEYDHAVNKAFNQNMRKKSSVCKTKYPLLMLHGIGFKDYKYINYWGRIPKNLIKNGASIYYGHQEALGTIEDNGEDVKNKILEIINETDSEKVNIIAHSKGGLDARYAVSKLGAHKYVASVTCISTPHRGSEIADFVDKLVPKNLYIKIANIFDTYFSKIGDKNPNFYVATHQFTKEYAEKFNKDVKDSENVYYQSYMSLMKNPINDLLLSIPFIILWFKAGKNDGMVSLESAKWGEFRKLYLPKKIRGVSHGDIIDLKREDIKGFDVIETYIDIVADLKNKGF